MTKKVTQRTTLLWKVRNFLPQDHIDFIYDGCNIGNRNRLQISQNAALRAVNKSPIDYPTAQLFADLEIDKLDTARQKSTLKIVYRAVANQGPKNLNHLFNIYIPKHELRSENTLLLLPPTTRTKFAENDIVHRGSGYWNVLPMNGKTKETLDQFKAYLKPYGTDCLK